MSVTDALSCSVATGQCVEKYGCLRRESGEPGAAHTRSRKMLLHVNDTTQEMPLERQGFSADRENASLTVSL